MGSTGKKVSADAYRHAFRELQQLCAGQKSLVLATSDQDRPHCSLMRFALGPDSRSFVLITPKDTRKYENIRRNTQVSTLVTETTPDESREAYGLAATVNGSIEIARGPKRLELVDLFTTRHPELQDFAESPESAVLHLQWREVVLVRGIHSVIRLDLAGSDPS